MGATRELYGGGTGQKGAEGFYAFGSQRLWRRQQWCLGIFSVRHKRLANNHRKSILRRRLYRLRPRAQPAGGFNRYRACLVVLNRRYGFRSNEAMLAVYYQMHLIGTSFFQPTLSYIPNPGKSTRTQGAVAITSQIRVLF
jgi:porin